VNAQLVDQNLGGTARVVLTAHGRLLGVARSIEHIR
jgi:hypothetical protein